MARRKEVFSNVNIVPYLDVMLVLLVIFMATAPVMQMGVNLDLPEGRSSPVQSVNPVILSVDKHGQRHLQMGEGKVDQVDGDEGLMLWLKRHKVGTERPIHLQADKSLPWQKVLSVLLEVNRMGWSKIALMTEEGSSEAHQ